MFLIILVALSTIQIYYIIIRLMKSIRLWLIIYLIIIISVRLIKVIIVRQLIIIIVIINRI